MQFHISPILSLSNQKDLQIVILDMKNALKYASKLDIVDNVSELSQQIVLKFN